MHRSKNLTRRLARQDALSVHFQLGLRAYDVGDLYALARHRTAVGMLPEGGAGSVEYMTLDWRAKWLHGAETDALAIAQDIADRFPDDPDAPLELGRILADMGRPEEAVEVLLGGTEQNGDDPDLWYEIGLTAEKLERWELRQKAFHTVWELEHDQAPAHRLWISEERFVHTVEATLERLPPLAQRGLGNVAIFVEDYPAEWVVADDVADPRILGLFDGPARLAEHSVDSVVDGPSRIYLYRWNIERTCASPEEVEEQVGITVLHEVGHYLGLDEEALHFKGLG